MFSQIVSAATFGVDAYLVNVETHLDLGSPKFFMVCLPDNAVKESIHRVTAAIKNSDFKFPNRKMTVNLAPADVKKKAHRTIYPSHLEFLLHQDSSSLKGPGENCSVRRISARWDVAPGSRGIGDCAGSAVERKAWYCAA